MKVIVDLCVVPIGVGVNLAPYIAACERVLLDAGLKIQLHPNGTAIEGEWGPVFDAIEACHQAVDVMGCPRRCQKNIPQLRLRDVQGTALRDERCSRLDLIGRFDPPGLFSPGFAHQRDRTAVWLTRPLGVATVWCHVGPSAFRRR